ncbi:MAG: dephospho-CoA kinase [Spirochaetales bacterium]|nr:dephospho-CoA kinase [Spirochaetales bacterium]MCF7938583.1 dephospho-CoA kinase [Spirochaetales bacterium]
MNGSSKDRQPEHRQLVIGVTGTYCAGKSTLVELLVEEGYAEVDVDRLGHRALVEKGEAVAGHFGPQVQDQEGGIDRRALGRVVFSDPQARKELESIVHPLMIEWVRQTVDALRDGQMETSPGLVINAALLFSMGLDRFCDVILLVRAPLLARLFRCMRRDGLGPLQILRRMRAQRSLFSHVSSDYVDIYTVWNRGTRQALRKRAHAILAKTRK